MRGRERERRERERISAVLAYSNTATDTVWKNSLFILFVRSLYGLKKERERERECVCVCVCVCEIEKNNGNKEEKNVKGKNETSKQ